MKRWLLTVSACGVGCLVSCRDPQVPRVVPNDGGAGVEVAAVEAATTPPSGTSKCGCDGYGDPVSHGPLPPDLDEASGLAFSVEHPGVVYTHNDSGDSARFFALQESDASQVSEIALVGVQAIDFEDIAVGPCPQGSCVWVADIGDNGKHRKRVVIHRVPEPTVFGAKLSLKPESFPYRYPDGPKNAEALLVHPKTGEVVVVVKVPFGEIGVYRLPNLTAGVEVVAERVGVVAGIHPLGQLVTAGAVSPCGDRLLLRTYGALYEYPIAGNLVDALQGAPTRVPVAAEQQGEAVTYRPNGKGYLTTSEGVGALLQATNCK